jgi:hypothetical protein
MNNTMRPWSSAAYDKRTEHGRSGSECCVCGKETNESLMVCCSPEDNIFCKPNETPEASLYYIGPDCAAKLKKVMPDVHIERVK